MTKENYQKMIKEEQEGKTATPKGHPVLLMHGLFMSAGVFVTNEEQSLAFYLADLGYDVWLGNNRGACLSHVKLSPSNRQFWNWCIDDLAKYDVPAMVDYVLKQNGDTKLTWIGLSQGNGQAFIALSSNPHVAEKIRIMIALAPTARIGQLP